MTETTFEEEPGFVRVLLGRLGFAGLLHLLVF
jgi:hypothetical protein